MPIPLRTDFDASQLRKITRKTKDGPQARRLLALASIYEGAARTEAAKIGGVTLQIVRDWVMKFNAHGPDGLVDKKAPGQAPRRHPSGGARQSDRRSSNPCDPQRVRWRLIDLCQWIFEAFRITVSLRAMGYRRLSARPRHHAQAEDAIEDFKKASPRAFLRSRAKRTSQPSK